MGVPSTAVAAVFEAPNQPFRITKFTIPPLKGRSGVACIRCATICGSDLHTYYGRRSAPAPSVLGHEMIGEIADTGPLGLTAFDGTPLRAGDRVTWSMLWTCGECFCCRNGPLPKCERLLKFGHEPLRSGFELFGGFAEFCYLPEGSAIFRLPQNVTDEAACPANCATATVAAILRHAGDVERQTAVVYGTGMLGLTACAMLRWRGAGQVIGIDTSPARMELARGFGADNLLDGSKDAATLRDAVRAFTGGRGADAVLELTGIPEVSESAFELLRNGGRLLLAGATYPARALSLSAEQIVRRMIRISGVYNYEPRDLQKALHFLSECAGRFPFDSLVERSFPLDQVQQAFEYAETIRPPRVAVRPVLQPAKGAST